MDGTFAGDGPGPRAMRWHEKNVFLASADQVAIDAVAAKMMGFDPMSIKFIRLAHERGLGCGDPSQIETVGEDISGGGLALRGKRQHLRQPRSEAHLLGPPQAPGKPASQVSHCALGLLRIQPLPQLILAPLHRQPPGARPP